MKRTRVLLATDYYYPHWTGIVKGMRNLVETLKGDVDFTIVTVQHEKNLARRDERFGYRILREPYLFVLSRSCYSLMAVYRFLTELASHDVVLINSPCANILPFTILARAFGKKVVIFHQGDLVLPKGTINKLIELTFLWCTSMSMRLSHRVSTYTQDYAEHSPLLRQFLYKFEPLLLPVITAKKSSVKHPSLEALRQIKKSGKIIFGFGGRFVEEKGCDILLEAIPRLRSMFPDSHFAFAGETKIFYENFFQKAFALIERTGEAIVFLGLLGEEELFEFYTIADFIVVPSRSDCFNLFQAEACLSGTPAIVTDTPGLRFLVKTTGFGLVAKREDPQDLADKLLQAIRARDTLLSNFPMVQSLLDLEQIRSKLLKVINNL